MMLDRQGLARLGLGLVAGFLVAGQVIAAPVQAGAYDELLLGVEPATGVLTGYFQTDTGAGQFSCIFYLTGKLTNAGARIETYFPETPKDRIAGTLAAKGTSVRVVLTEEPGGCAMAWHVADKDQPADFTLSAAHPWTQIRVVRAKKAYFYNAPNSPTHRNGYLVQGDGVGVRATSAGWLQVDYPGADKITSGWVRAADLYPAP